MQLNVPGTSMFRSLDNFKVKYALMYVFEEEISLMFYGCPPPI